MSISLFVYSPAPPLDRDLLTATCLNPGLGKELHWELAFATEGRVLGWRPDSPTAAAVRAAVAAADQEALDGLYEREALASVWMHVTTRDAPEWKNVIDEGLIGAIPEKHRDAVRQARTHYELETYAKRNDLSLDFQYQLWRVVGVLSNGLMEDPQEGQYVTKDGEVTQLESAGDDPELMRELARIDSAERGQRLFTAGAAVLLAVQATAIPFIAQRFGPRQLVTAVLQLGLVVLFWYLARKGESSGYWGLVFVAFGFAGMWMWALVTPPPSPLGWTLLQTFRTIGHIAAGTVLLLPATRAYVRGLCVD